MQVNDSRALVGTTSAASAAVAADKQEGAQSCSSGFAPASAERVTLGALHFKEANEQVRQALDRVDDVALEDVQAQRYLGCALPAGKRLRIHGTPGNDLACFMDGGTVEVLGNAQDQVGNTMNAGEVIVHGRCGDAAGYAMRGGRVFIRDGCGWRAGIHMKAYDARQPVVVVGKDAGSFLGEYMAGGVFVVLGETGDYLARGMHGGVIYLKNPPRAGALSDEVVLSRVDDADLAVLAPLLAEYDRLFASELGYRVSAEAPEFFRVTPASSRPYASMYVR